MFAVGAIIFAAYIYLTIWSIYYNSRKQQEENYPTLTGMGEPVFRKKSKKKKVGEKKTLNRNRTSR